MIYAKVGQILEALDRNGYLDDAVVIFTSDHGDCLGDHGQIQKWTMYDIVTRVPTVVWAPGRFESGRRVTELYQWMDLGPTILELAGVEPPAWMEAISLLPALRADPDTPGRDHVFTEQGRDSGSGFETSFATAVRSRDWKLVHFLDEPSGQLFDLTADPTKRSIAGATRPWPTRSANCWMSSATGAFAAPGTPRSGPASGAEALSA